MDFRENNIINSPILVTGADHSGTTWIGKILALSKGVGYIHEPFNPRLKWGTNWLNTRLWYRYYSLDESDPFEQYKKTLSWMFNYKKAVSNIENIKDVLHLLKDVYVTYKNRVCGARVIVKDPIAIMSVPWLVKNFNMQVIVIVRHPAGFISSRLKRNLSFPFHDLLAQESLIHDKLSDFKDEIVRQTNKPAELMAQNILLWRLIYNNAKNYMNMPNCIFVKYEDICINPVCEIRHLYDRLNLSWSDDICRHIQKYSLNNTKSRVSRNSKNQSYIFKQRLDKDEIEKIKRETSDIWPLFYNDEEW